MKNLVLLVLFFVTTVCSAQIEIEGNKDGSYRIKEDAQEWTPSGVTAGPETINYIDKFSQAINSPDTPILVKEDNRLLKLTLGFKKLVKVEEHFIVYKEEGNNIRFFMNVETKEESSGLILFSIASILLMIMSNILFKKGHDGFATVLAAVAAFSALAFLVAAATTTTLLATTTTALAVLAAVAAFAAFAALQLTEAKHYKLASTIFYILMAIHIVLLFM